MDDFEARPGDFSPTVPDLPSQHSGFRSNNVSEYSEGSSRRSYSPPTWRRAGSGWFKDHMQLSPNRSGFGSKEPSPQYHSAEDEGYGDVTAWRSATRVPLPVSPTKGRTPSNSTEPAAGVGASESDQGGGDATLVNARMDAEEEAPRLQTPTESNCRSSC